MEFEQRKGEDNLKNSKYSIVSNINFYADL